MTRLKLNASEMMIELNKIEFFSMSSYFWILMKKKNDRKISLRNFGVFWRHYKCNISFLTM